jgi:hypothetical protein
MGRFDIPAGTITNSDLSASAAVAASKVVHQISAVSQFATGTTVAAKTEVVHVARAAGTIGALKVFATVAPTGGTLAYTVDLQKSTGGGAFASVLSAAYTVDATKTDRTAYSGTLSTTTYAAGDALAIVWAVSGATGTQGIGACATVFLEEPTA